MVLDRSRGFADGFVAPVARRLARVDPNVITWSALPVAIIAGVLYYLSHPVTATSPWLLFAALVLLGLTAFLDLLDGKVAVLFGKTSAKGDYLDHALDRVADIAFIGGVALSGWVDLRIGFIAMSAILLVSYLGTQAQAVGARRDYGGLLGRADRLAILAVATAIDIVRLLGDWSVPAFLHVGSALELMMWYFAAAGIITAVQRFAHGLGSFR
jgi:archaetidylinositol phosphate synthase